MHRHRPTVNDISRCGKLILKPFQFNDCHTEILRWNCNHSCECPHEVAAAWSLCDHTIQVLICQISISMGFGPQSNRIEKKTSFYTWMPGKLWRVNRCISIGIKRHANQPTDCCVKFMSFSMMIAENDSSWFQHPCFEAAVANWYSGLNINAVPIFQNVFLSHD